ncbi:MAG: helicase C-terminal domain-containing protein [Halobacteriaceae archaeon]
MDPSRIVEEFPAPQFRGNQRDALERVGEAFAAGNEVVLVRAPTGTGKSLLARAIMGCARTPGEAGPGEPTGAYYTTPQVSQLEDVAADDLLDDFRIVRGKNNYTCLLDGEADTPVDRAPCARQRGFDCEIQHRCPYFADRARASGARFAATTLAYFMHTAGSDAFGERDVVVVDEAHGLAEWAETYATIELGPHNVPRWEEAPAPDVEAADHPLRAAVEFAEEVIDRCDHELEGLRRAAELTAEEAARRDRLADLRADLAWFVEDCRDHDSPTTWVVDQGEQRLAVKPMNPGRYLRHTVWDRGRRFALLSATILDGDAFARSVGLDPADVALVDVAHTFPLDNRPLYDVTCGKMTYEEREDTLPAVARTVVRAMAAHPEEKGIVHAHSYAIQAELGRRLADFGVGARVVAHDSDDREAALDRWKADDRPLVFLAVKMEEALDLAGDLARFQVLCKTPFANTGDARVARRLEEGRWDWYYRTALGTVIQACGRVVRSPDDYGATYIADSSLLDLFERVGRDVPAWFDEQVAAMTEPDLPAFDPEAALAGMDAEQGATRAAGHDAGGDHAGTARGQRGGRDRRRDTGSGAADAGDDRRDSEVADVWDADW